jgi:hypothetical protein
MSVVGMARNLPGRPAIGETSAALTGLGNSIGQLTQGVALGYHLSGFQPLPTRSRTPPLPHGGISFGANDLTQTALGLSRDDSGSFLPGYAELEIVKKKSLRTVTIRHD